MRKLFAAIAALGFLALFGPAAAQGGDVARGARVFALCKACHTVEKGGRNGIGPNLHGVFGNKAGRVEGFAFSDAMKKTGIVWDDKAMAAFLNDPKGRVPGTRMNFAGIRRSDQLTDLLAFLREATQ